MIKVAEPTVERLVQYHRLLGRLQDEGQRVVSSQQVGDLLGIKASQVRKDLSYFGEIGKRGVGYHVGRLYEHVLRILGSPKTWRVALVGAGNLGVALIGHSVFKNQSFCVEALFDIDPKKVGREIAGVRCWHFDEMIDQLKEREIEILVLAVPASAAQLCVDKAVSSGGIKGILSFSPTTVITPKGVLVYSVDVFAELEKLLFYLKTE